MDKLFQLINDKNTAFAALTLAASGYILSLLKSIPITIFSMLVTKYTKSIYVTSDNPSLFKFAESMIYDMYPSIFSNHISLEKTHFAGIDKEVSSIAPGFYHKVLWRKLTVVNISKMELNINNFNTSGADGSLRAQLFRLTISVYGLHSNEILRDFKALLDNYNSGLLFNTDKYIKICKPSEYRGPFRSYVNKKNRDNIYDEKSLDIIDKHLEKFINNKDMYNRIGDAYKTGILLHGKPGTGKSCLAKYIGSKLNAMVVPINNLGREQSMDIVSLSTVQNYMSNVKGLIVVLIEEIDKIILSPDYSDYTNRQMTINQNVVRDLLVFMDGLNTPNNMIVVATTNNKDALPEALLRKGRFDLVLEMNGITKDDAIRMCHGFGCYDHESILAEINVDSETGLYNPSELRYTLLNRIYY